MLGLCAVVKVLGSSKSEKLQRSQMSSLCLKLDALFSPLLVCGNLPRAGRLTSLSAPVRCEYYKHKESLNWKIDFMPTVGQISTKLNNNE